MNLTIELADVTTEQLTQQNISEEQLTNMVRQFVQLYLSKPELWEGLRDLAMIFPASRQSDSLLYEAKKPNSTTREALEQARTRQMVEKFATAEELFIDLEI